MTDNNIRDNVVVVILQYGAVSETKKCIESLYKYVEIEFHIILVDNCSPDDAAIRAQAEYGKKEEVTILTSKENLGFAKGNNIGFRFAKENLNPRYIIMLNNDTELLQKDFVKQIDNEYGKSHFYVMGPMILTGDGCYTSNPIRRNPWKKEEVEHCIQLEKAFLTISKCGLSSVYYWLVEMKNKKKNRGKKKDTRSFTNRMEDVALHGAFMIFSKDYIDEYDGLDDRTFMYGEEAILYTQMKKHGHKMIYNPNIAVYHAEDASTNSTIGKRKTVFYLKNHIESCKILLRVIEEEKNG